jgi:predicted anti-sigma-YlaC factor YlaD
MANDHQLFEKWLFSDGSMDPEESSSHEEHLRECESCRSLSVAWGEVERQMNHAPHISPNPGFVDRWQIRLAEDQVKKHRRQALSMLFISVIGAAILIVSLALILAPVFKSPLPLLMIWAYQFVSMILYASMVGDALVTFTRTVFGVIPSPFWVGLLVAVGSLGLVWILAFRKLTSIWRITS